MTNPTTAQPLKAWRVDYDDGNQVTGEIVFAATRGRARVNNIFFGWCDRFTDLNLTVKRAPQFDQYAAEGWVPVSALLADGWWFECGDCGKRCPREDEDGREITPICDGGPGEVWCNEACRERAIAKDREYAERNAARDGAA